MKRILSKTAEVILCTLTVVAAVAFVFFKTPATYAAEGHVAEVKDIASSSEKDKITELLYDGVFPLYAENGEYAFLPYDATDRAYMALSVSKIAKLSPSDYADVPLDVADAGSIPAEYLPYVKAAVLSGIMPVYSAGGKTYFYPGRNVSREEAAYVLSKLADGAASSSKIDGYSDHDDVSEAFYAGVDKALTLGIADGYADGTFRPKSAITHEELAAWAYNLKHMAKT